MKKILTAFSLAFILLFVGCSSNTNSDIIKLKDGVHEVGKKVPVGTYRVVLNDTSKSYPDEYKNSGYINVYDNNNLEEPTDFVILRDSGYGYINIADSDLYVDVGGVNLEKIDINNIAQNYADSYSPGKYIVGKDIAPGMYKVELHENAYQSTGFLYRMSNLEVSLNNNIRTYIYGTEDSPIEQYKLRDIKFIEIKETDSYVMLQDIVLTKVENKKQLSNGSYRVGEDIESGVYKVEKTNPDNYSMVYRLKDYIDKDTVGDGSNVLGTCIIPETYEHSYINIKKEDGAIYLADAILTKLDSADYAKDFQNILSQDNSYLSWLTLETGNYNVEVINSDTNVGYVTLYSDLLHSESSLAQSYAFSSDGRPGFPLPHQVYINLDTQLVSIQGVKLTKVD